MLLRPDATFELAERLRGGSVAIGEVYRFISGLYFRGKVAYAAAFANAPNRRYAVIQNAILAAPRRARSAADLASVTTSFTRFSASAWLMPVCAAISRAMYVRSGAASSPLT